MGARMLRWLVLVVCGLPVLVDESAATAAPITERVSVSSAEVQANGGAWDQMAVSADGRYVVFVSDASNLVPGDTNGVSDVFLRDRAMGTIERISVSRKGVQANGESTGGLAISTHGGFVVFTTYAGNIAKDTYRGYPYTIIVNRSTGVRTSIGQLGLDQGPDNVAISDGGRYVAFDSPEKDWTYVIRFDRVTGVPCGLESASCPRRLPGAGCDVR